MAHYSIMQLEAGYVPAQFADFSLDGFCMPGGRFYNPFSMTLLRGEGLNILIDSGIGVGESKNAIMAAAGVEKGRGTAEILATVGLAPEDIDAVIITHFHWDHVGGVAELPRAKVYIQREELTSWRDIIPDPDCTAISCRSTDAVDLGSFAALEAEGRLVPLDGECDGLLPGVDIRVSAFAHSFAQQMALIHNDDALWLAIGDVANRPENLAGCEEFPFFIPNPKFAVGAPMNAVRDYKRIRDWTGGDMSRVIMSHDSTLREKYPSRSSALGLDITTLCP